MRRVMMIWLGFCLIQSVKAQNPTGMLVPTSNLVRDTSGQEDIIHLFTQWTHIKFKKPKKERGKTVYYSLLPLGTSIPGGGNALITATTAGFYTGDRRNTYISTITFSPSTNFKGKYNLPFHANIWSPGNGWNYSADTRFSFYPQYTWGLGGGQKESDYILMRYEYARFYGTVLKRIKPWLFAGLGYNFDYRVDIRTDNDTVSLQEYTKYPYGTANHSNSFSSGVTFNLLYDTRNNALNPLPGYFLNFIYRVNPKFLGSDDSWHSFYIDLRKYISFNEHSQNVLALWSYYWTAPGGNVPYLDLPAIGWDPNQRSGRGFYTGRVTGKSLWDFEVEYRRSITANELLGFVVFGNVNSVTEPVSDRFEYLHPAIGAGLRIKFNKHSGTNFGVDFACSKGNQAIYLNLGEAF